MEKVSWENGAKGGMKEPAKKKKTSFEFIVIFTFSFPTPLAPKVYYRKMQFLFEEMRYLHKINVQCLFVSISFFPIFVATNSSTKEKQAAFSFFFFHLFFLPYAFFCSFFALLFEYLYLELSLIRYLNIVRTEGFFSFFLEAIIIVFCFPLCNPIPFFYFYFFFFFLLLVRVHSFL